MLMLYIFKPIPELQNLKQQMGFELLIPKLIFLSWNIRLGPGSKRFEPLLHYNKFATQCHK